MRGQEVLMNFGKYENEHVEIILLKDPSYIKWMFDREDSTRAMKMIMDKAEELIQNFDSKKFIGKKCSSGLCGEPATAFTVYLQNIDPYWWCDQCDPYQSGASPEKLQSPTDYWSALKHVEIFCNNRKSDYAAIIKMIAQSKGLPKRAGKSQILNFFYGSEMCNLI